MLRHAVGVALAMGGLLAPRGARADINDLVLARLSNQVDNGAAGITFVPQNADFRALASQLGVVLAPHLLTPADTLGYAGFQLTVDYATTTIDPGGVYWRARQGSATPGALTTVGIFARKGMWFPAPALEFGVGAVHLVDSHVWTGQLYAKFALVEGYHQLPIPSVAFRGAVSRMMTQQELDLTTISLDLMISKHIGVAGTWRLDPFAGFNTLLIVPRSEVIDPTPQIDPLQMGNENDALLNFVFKDQDDIIRNRVVVGAKLQYYVVQLTLEADFALAGSSVDDRPGTTDPCMLMTSDTTNCDAKDSAKGQRTLSLSAGFDF